MKVTPKNLKQEASTISVISPKIFVVKSRMARHQNCVSFHVHASLNCILPHLGPTQFFNYSKDLHHLTLLAIFQRTNMSFWCWKMLFKWWWFVFAWLKLKWNEVTSRSTLRFYTLPCHWNFADRCVFELKLFQLIQIRNEIVNFAEKWKFAATQTKCQ